MPIGRALVKQRARVQKTARRLNVKRIAYTRADGKTVFRNDNVSTSPVDIGLSRGINNIICSEELYAPVCHIMFITWEYVPTTKREKRIYKGIVKSLVALGATRLPLRDSHKPKWRINARAKATVEALKAIEYRAMGIIYLTEIN